MNDRYTDDDRLVSELAALRDRVEPVPDSVVAAARAAFGSRDVDEELAALVYDSALDDGAPVANGGELARVRGISGRRLTFEGQRLTVEVKLGPDRRLIGQLAPAQEADIEVRSPEASSTVRADALGRFVFDEVPEGPMKLRCRSSSTGGMSVQTEWVML